MSARFGHWSVWRLNYFRMMDLDTQRPDLDYFWAEVGNLDWKTMVNHLYLVLQSLVILDASLDGPRTAGPMKDTPLTQSELSRLRKLIQLHKLHFLSSYEHPENAIFVLLSAALVRHRTSHLVFVIYAQFFCNRLMNYILNRYSPWCLAPNVINILALCSPYHSLKMDAFGTPVTLYELAGSPVNALPACAATSAIRSSSLLPNDFQLYPMTCSIQSYVTRRTIADAERLPQEEFTNRKRMVGFGGMTHKYLATGIYRSFFHYNAAELTGDYDAGVVELFQDTLTGRISGHGVDTVRGRFKVYDGRSNSELNNIAAGIVKTESNMGDSCGNIMDVAIIILEYESGEAITLNMHRVGYAYGGYFEKTFGWPKGGNNAVSFYQGSRYSATVPGCFSLVYDHQMSTLPAEERQLAYMALEKEFEERTAIFNANSKFRVSRFKRERLRDLPLNYPANLDSAFHNAVERVSDWSVLLRLVSYSGIHPETVKLVHQRAARMDPAVVSWLEKQTWLSPPERNIMVETEELYQLRLRTYKGAAAALATNFCDLVAMLPEEALNTMRSINGPSEETANQLGWWVKLARLHPNTFITHPEAFFAVFTLAVNNMLKSYQKEKSDSSAATPTTADKPTPKRPSPSSIRSSRATSWSLDSAFSSPRNTAITLGSMLGFVASVGIGAFAIARALQTKKPQQ